MHIAILTFDGFNELDSFIALGILNRVKRPGWRVALACPTPTVTSMNGVTVQRQESLEEASAALEPEPRTGYELSFALFGEDLKPAGRRFAVAETLSHLERLVQVGAASRTEVDGTVAYTAA